jgi:hypothetical protein
MAGDTNLFMFDPEQPHVAEIMVMIAEPELRRKGLAREAVQLMMTFGGCQWWCSWPRCAVLEGKGGPLQCRVSFFVM